MLGWKMNLTKVVRCETIGFFEQIEQYEYSLEKDELLIRTRHIGFDDVIRAVENGQLLEMVDHHNQKKYPRQQFLIVSINNYVYTVPFVTKDVATLFLKTIFRNRKLTRKYLRKEFDYEKENNKAENKTRIEEVAEQIY